MCQEAPPSLVASIVAPVAPRAVVLLPTAQHALAVGHEMEKRCPLEARPALAG